MKYSLAEVLKKSITVQQRGNSLQILLDNDPQFQQFWATDIHILSFPYDHGFSTEEVTIAPFEDVAQNIANGKKVYYQKIQGAIDKLFGIIAAAVGLAIFLVLSDNELFTPENLIPLFGIYFIAKDFWSDIDTGLTYVTRNFMWRFKTTPFTYIKTTESRTFDKLMNDAQTIKYGKDMIIPSKYDLITNSDSKIVRLWYTPSDLKYTNSKQVLLAEIKRSDAGHILNLTLGIKVNISTKFLLVFNKNTEVLQSIRKAEVGAVDFDGKWNAKSAIVTSTLNLGRLELSRKSRTIFNYEMIVS